MTISVMLEAVNKEKGYIYIVQASLEPSKCKIGKTLDLERRLKEYNNMTGKSQDNIYSYLFACEVSDMAALEKDIKERFNADRENKNKEMYFYNAIKFADYVDFIKTHDNFIKKIIVQDAPPQEIKIIKKTTPSLEERGVTRKDLLQKAKKSKNDEFYTQYEDVEKEVSMYDKSVWQDKCVFCNCDDAVDDKNDEKRTSAFALYFMRNFKELGLKKLICTHYAGGIDLFNQGAKGYAAYITYTTNGIDIERKTPAGYDGSFDAPLSLKILKEEADIVCTNPPFSRMRDYWKIVVESGKKFLIISNFTNVKNQPYMSYIKNNKVWAGYNRVDFYLNPKKQLAEAAGHWYTNFPVHDRPKYNNIKIIPLNKIPLKYKRYDDNKVLVVDNNYIPSNIKEPFAVSVYPILSGILEKGFAYVQDVEYVPYIKGRRCFGRVLVQKIGEVEDGE